MAPEQMVGFAEPGSPEVRFDPSVVSPCIIVSSRFVPTAPAPHLDRTTALVTPEGLLIGWHVREMSELPGGECGSLYEGPLPTQVLSGRLLESVWQLMAENADQLMTDMASDAAPLLPPQGGTVYGDFPIQLAPDVVIGPHVLFDARQGPIRIEAGVSIEPMTVVGGPCFVGAETTLLGGLVRASSIGPRCKIRGEVDTSVVLGFCNKAHDGYLGHAVLGRWVNLGAMTTNSDLKNNYSAVRIDLGDGPIDTGDRKVGIFLGDHVKTGIGTLLGTGTVVGAGCNVMAGPIPPRYVPPFSWGAGRDFEPYEIERFLATTRVVMERRDQILDDGMERLLREAWNSTRGSGA